MLKKVKMTVAAVAAGLAVTAGAVEFGNHPVGPVKPVNGVGQPPILGYNDYSMFRYLKDAGVPFARLHDVGGPFGKNIYVDIPNLFRDFDADENDPASYDFSFTDLLMKALVENGVEPYFRFGVTIENAHAVKAYRIFPPKDYAKWARICEHVVRHYTEGWADGFRMKVTHWEVWNEPENFETIEKNAMWKAPFEEYIRLYAVASKHLKEKFPHLKIGGYASCGFYGVASAWAKPDENPRIPFLHKCFRDFLAACRDQKLPLDFFSFHCYDYAEFAEKQIAYCRKTLDAYGFKDTEMSLNEWLPCLGGAKAAMCGTPKQAADIAAMLCVMQNGSVDDAEIYDAKATGGAYAPFFEPDTHKPRKAYFVYLAFNELRKLGQALPAPKVPEGVFACAATDGKGRCALLVANPTREAVDFDFEAPGYVIDSSLCINEKRDYTPPRTRDGYMRSVANPDGLGRESVWLVRYRRAGEPLARPDLVAKVRAGELKEAHAAWWGFDPDDSSRFLQAAIDSGAKKVIVDKMDAPWTVSRTISARSNQELVFERGVTLLAKRGEFRSNRDKLFSAHGVTNLIVRGYGAEFRMWKEDYQTPAYPRGEWRHALSISSCTNVVVEGLTLSSSGGDGLCVGGDYVKSGYSGNITIRDVTSDNNHRQGVSITGVDGLLMENCTMSNTKGTPPEAGIDFETDRPQEVIRNCVLRNCRTINNNDIGYEFYLGPVREWTPPFDVTFENCLSSGDAMGFTFTDGVKTKEMVHDDGKLVFRNCRFENSRIGAARVTRNPHMKGRVEFHDCVFDNCYTNRPFGADIRLRTGGHDPKYPDEVLFNNLTVIQPIAHPWINLPENPPTDGTTTRVFGNVKVITPAGERDYEFK